MKFSSSDGMLKSRRDSPLTVCSANKSVLLIFCFLLISASVAGRIEARQAHDTPPPDVSPDRKGLIGEYTLAPDTVCIMERDGALSLIAGAGHTAWLKEESKNRFSVGPGWVGGTVHCTFKRDSEGFALSFSANEQVFERIFYGGEHGGVSFRIRPVKNVDDLRKEALAAKPPREDGRFLKSDLVELRVLDSTIHLDVRYATTNNFVGEKFYSQARAFLQRPAAEALVSVVRELRQHGYGLLVFDAYRPWYVKKMFWDATPPDQKIFVADPAKGSRHNRGCAVDLTMYDLKTGKPVDMVSGYDEFSHRAYPGYQCGTSLQRWNREYLRRIMEAHGFRIFESEWWHFDYKDWRQYSIGTLTFEEIH